MNEQGGVGFGQMGGGIEEVLSSNTRLCCSWLWDKQCWQVVRSGIRAQGNGRESPAVGRRRIGGVDERWDWDSSNSLEVWWRGLENPQLLPKCEKFFSLSFFFAYVGLEEDSVMGIQCQTSKTFNTFNKSQAKYYFKPHGFSG